MYGLNRTSTSRAVATTSALATVIAGMVLWAPPAQAATVTTVINGVTYTANDANQAAGATATSFVFGPTSVTIPASVVISGTSYDVKHIDDYSFDGDGLTSVTLPSGLLTIEEGAFADNDLESVVIPSSVTEIKDLAFDSNELTSVAIPNGVTNVGWGAFRFNDLVNVTLPGSLTIIGSNSFTGNDIASVTVPNGATDIQTDAFYDNEIASVSLPSTLTSIGGGAFDKNVLTSVTIPASVTSIGGSAFNENPALSSVKFLGGAPAIAGDAGAGNETFDTASGSLVLHYPAAHSAGYTPSPWHGYTTAQTALDTATINGITYEADPSNVPAGAEITGYAGVPNSIVSIPASVTINGQAYAVKKIGDEAFQFKFLSKVTIPSSVQTIDAQAFQGNNLTTVTIPNSVTLLGDLAFYQNSLSSVTISNAITAIGESTFQQNHLTSVTIPNSVSSIGESAFEGNQLTSVTIGTAVTSIGINAFRTNEDLTSVRFLGAAPATITAAAPSHTGESFDTTSGSLVVNYAPTFGPPTINGFATPTWKGYTTKPLLTGLAPGISGNPREGQTLTAITGPINPEATLAYQWKADGVPIAGATNATYLLRGPQAGRRMSVTVTATFPGADALVRSSGTTRQIISSIKHLVVSKTTVKKGTGFAVTATGFKPYQKVKVILNGKTRWTGRADGYGMVNRWVTFASSTTPGVRSVRVSGYSPSGTIVTWVKYYK